MKQRFEIYVQIKDGRINSFLNCPAPGYVKANVEVTKERKTSITEMEFDLLANKMNERGHWTWKEAKEILFGELA